jgi:hypothetical protein
LSCDAAADQHDHHIDNDNNQAGRHGQNDHYDSSHWNCYDHGTGNYNYIASA